MKSKHEEELARIKD
jgi:hypothetical protein